MVMSVSAGVSRLTEIRIELHKEECSWKSCGDRPAVDQQDHAKLNFSFIFKGGKFKLLDKNEYLADLGDDF